jgi:hypothetical protein
MQMLRMGNTEVRSSLVTECLILRRMRRVFRIRAGEWGADCMIGWVSGFARVAILLAIAGCAQRAENSRVAA